MQYEEVLACQPLINPTLYCTAHRNDRGKKYFLFQRKKSQKIFEGHDDPRRVYLLRLSLREHPAAKKLRQLSSITPRDVSSDAAQLLGNLAKLIKSQRVLDIGRSCGYNPLVLALVLPADGKVTASFSETENSSDAKEFWREAGVDKKIDIQVKSAEQTLDDLLSAGEAGKFDLVFINMADEQNCRKCYEKSLRLVRSGGILAIDGVLCYGAALKLNSKSLTVQAMHQLSEAILRDARIALSILPVGDGLMLCFKL
ncbi:catechol O-methyltransferase domain-containing 1 [Pelobates cultripes]|uniref:Catechol O-methyltransferase domain-containing 1 n=1 Tax=Pelobates cultripes TaxID=61616 RepID=A0AAD1TE88_PELCU|nr:catechol O-methyltransferase domain-containing 1 [Pelobates cultripes]